ncbi:MAG: hypothetical protein LBU34_12375 [Planctomycetaceae bacterium]|nr:hypothetical protein [Planctomycetaceae bacterium]
MRTIHSQLSTIYSNDCFILRQFWSNLYLFEAFKRAKCKKCRATTGNCRVTIGNCRMTTGNCRATTGNCRMTTGNCRLATGDCRLATGDCRMTTGDCRVTIDNCRMTFFDIFGVSWLVFCGFVRKRQTTAFRAVN